MLLTNTFFKVSVPAYVPGKQKNSNVAGYKILRLFENVLNIGD